MGIDETNSARDPIRALVYENVRDVVFLLAVEDGHFRFLEINPAFTEATGLHEDQVVGRLVEEIIPEPSLSIVLANYRAAVSERRTVRWEEVTAYPAGKKFGQVSITPLVSESGECKRLVGTVHDTTDEARARALARTEQRVLERIASGATLEETLSELAIAIEEQIPPALASVLLISEDGAHVVNAAAPNLPSPYNRAIDGLPIGEKGGSCGTAAARKKPVIVVDIDTDPLWERYRELARGHGLRACWSTPILSRDERVLGTFAVYYREPRAPTQRELELIARVVHVAGIAIQRHELDDQLRALSTRIETAREEERAGLARELHDQLGQSLTVLKMDLAWIARRATSPAGIVKDELLGKLKDLSTMTDEIINQTRRISAELRPGLLDDLGLSAALSWQAAEFKKRTGIETTVIVNAAGVDSLPRAVSTTVFRALQEALTNVVRHSGASKVTIRLEESGGWLELGVHDDGKGIRPEHVSDPRSLGIVGMRERARRLGGSVAFEGGLGTTVSFRLPLERS